MLIRHEDGELLIVRQTDHMAQVARMAERWGNEHFPAPAHREETIRAAGLHDGGWRLWEDNPSLLPETGRPRNLTELDRPVHAAFYREGVNAAVAVDPYTGLLVSLHAAVLYAGVEGWDLETLAPPSRPDFSEVQRAFVEDQIALQRSLRVRLATSPRYAASVAPDRLWPAYLRLRVWDQLSLYFLYYGLGERTIDHMPANHGESVLTLRQTGPRIAVTEPWPFDRPVVSFPVVGCRMPDRPYPSDEAFLADFAAARQEIWEFTLEPGV